MKYIFYTACLLLFFSCRENYTPKPYGYFRISFPPKAYRALQDPVPYRFQIAREAHTEPDKSQDAEPYWINIVYPAYQAKINLSYKPITSDTSLVSFEADCHRMAYAHTIKAESINERFFQQPNGIFGVLYVIEGNAASPAQFFITDSVRHFLRGSLYLHTHPDKDSLAPVINYLREDIVHLMETLSFAPAPSR